MASSAITTAPFLAKVKNFTDDAGVSFSQFIPSGVVLPFAGTTAPAGFLLCNGAAVSRSTYGNLFQAIGTVHGAGDGSTTFHLPDYRGRFLRGADAGAARDPDRATRTAANSGGATGDSVGSVQSNATARNGLTASSGNQSADHGHTGTSGGISANHTHGLNGDGSHQHSIWAGMVSHADSGGWPQSRTLFTTSDRHHGNGRHINDSVADWGGWHAHGWGTGTVSSDHSHVTTTGGVNTNHSHSVAVNTGDNETRPHNAAVNYIIKI